jgi:thioredoxin 1
MNQQTLQKTLEKNPAVLVEFWAPWCGPCKMMSPMYIKAEKEFKGKVQLVRINVDENPDLARSYKVFSIPTVIGFRNGKQFTRKTGAMQYEQLHQLFENSLQDNPNPVSGIAPFDRTLRLVAALGLGILAYFSGNSLILYAAAGLVFFLAVHDRCPIWRAVTGWWKKRRTIPEP